MTNATLLHRHVHPSWVQQGRITSQVFRPTPKDAKKLSVYDGGQISPAECWEHFVGRLGFSSIGIVAVAVSDCLGIELVVTPDPTSHPAHTVIDFAPCNENDIKRKSKQLKAFAETRGWQYRNEEFL